MKRAYDVIADLSAASKCRMAGWAVTISLIPLKSITAITKTIPTYFLFSLAKVL